MEGWDPIHPSVVEFGSRGLGLVSRRGPALFGLNSSQAETRQLKKKMNKHSQNFLVSSLMVYLEHPEIHFLKTA